MGSDRCQLSLGGLIVAEIVNLRLARKAKARRTSEDAAAVNRARHGLTKAARDLARTEAERAARQHEAHSRNEEP